MPAPTKNAAIRGFSFFLFYYLTLNIALTQTTFKCEDGPFFHRRTVINYMVIENGNISYIETPEMFPLAPIADILGYNTLNNSIYSLDKQGPFNAAVFQHFPDGSFIELFDLDSELENRGVGGGTIRNGTNKMYFHVNDIIQNFTPTEIMVVDVTQQTPIEYIGLTALDSDNFTMTFGLEIDPITGTAYGLSFDEYRIVTIDLETGVVDNVSFPPNPDVKQIGNAKGFFFDNFGNLFLFVDKQFLYHVNKQNGTLNLVATYDGPESVTEDDMCNCTNIPGLQLDIQPNPAYACSDAKFTYRIFHNDIRAQDAVVLRDTLPAGFIFKEVLSNHPGGTVTGLGTNILTVTDISLPAQPTLDSIEVIVAVPADAVGAYENQAFMTGFDSDIVGNSDIVYASDYDATVLVKKDPTPFTVQEFSLGNINDSFVICPDSSLILRPLEFAFGFNYEWENGSTAPEIEVQLPGVYNLTLSNNCESVFVPVQVADGGIEIDLAAAASLPLGDELTLSPVLTSTASDYGYLWTSDELVSTLTCTDCPETSLTPEQNTLVTFTAENEFNCTVAQEVAVNVTTDIYFPTAFSPNNDGINDYFIPLSKNPYEIRAFKIFDRWGNILYEAEDILTNGTGEGWDGRVNGDPADTGVYVWFAEIFAGGKSLSFKGDVTIIE